MAAKPRLHHFDMLKGLAIFLVVMGHVLTMCIRDIDRTLLFKIIGQIHMPMFFFISGYFTYKILPDGKLRLPDIGSRFRQLIIPGIVVGMIWMVYFPHSGLQSPFNMTFEGMWCTEFKNGYWFTIVLFSIIMLYCIWSRVLPLFKRTSFQILTTVVLWGILAWVDSVFEAEMLWRLLSLKLVIAFFPAFMAGVFARKYGDKFYEFCNNSWVYTVSLLLAGALVYLLVYPWEFPSITSLVFVIAEPVMHICVAIVGVALVLPWSNKAFAPEASALSHRFASIWEYIGTQSLAIYLLHYFFLFPLSMLQEPMRTMGLDLAPALFVSGAVAAIIVATTLLVNAFIQRSKFLALVLTGKTPA